MFHIYSVLLPTVLSRTKFGDKSIMENVRQVIPVCSSMDQKGFSSLEEVTEVLFTLERGGKTGVRRNEVTNLQSWQNLNKYYTVGVTLKNCLKYNCATQTGKPKDLQDNEFMLQKSGIINALQNFQQKDGSLSPCFICARSIPKINIVVEEVEIQSSSSPNADLQL